MRKMLTLTAVMIGGATVLTGCAELPGGSAADPAAGHWTTVKVQDRAVGDVWCITGSDYSEDSFDCQWSTLTAANTHGKVREAEGEYRYLTLADGSEHRTLCINYRTRKGYRVLNCNWEGAEAR